MKRLLVAAFVVAVVSAALFGVTSVKSTRAADVPGSVLHLLDPSRRYLDTRGSFSAILPAIPSSNNCATRADGVTYIPPPMAPAIPADSAFCVRIPAGPYPGQTSLVDPAATGLLMNVTATNSEGPGFVQIVGSNGATGATSNLNKIAGQSVANQVTVPIGPIPFDEFFFLLVVNQGGATDLVIDILGAYVPAQT
jgi:hypothetical protein